MARVLTVNLGFYRPMVTLTFSADFALFDLHAFGYALTNFLILASCVWAVRRFNQAIGLDWVTATVACALWALNFHGIGGALLWISGRTSLLVTLFALVCMTSWVHRQYLATAGWPCPKRTRLRYRC